MYVVVTGANGKVGSAAVEALQAAGHRVRATDTARGVFERPEPDAPEYWQADLTDAGDAFALVRGADAVVHAAAIPDPSHNPPHVVFHNNAMAAFNVVEAAVRWGVRRLVNISSETVPGFLFPERPASPDYVPVDEDHPIRPQDPYAFSKYVGELLCDAAVRRSDLRCTSLRPSWVQHAGNYAHNLGPTLRQPGPSANFWSYIDVADLADAIRLAVESDLPGHEVFYIASPDNHAGRPLRELIADHADPDVEVRDLPQDDASGISTAKAQRMLGWRPTRSWRDHLDDDGRPRG
ncbi:MAG TPA: NAD(P)-dependent oxidoreductase [Euzebyales bacterium]